MGQAAPEELRRRLRSMAAGSKLRSHSRWAPRFAFMSACLVVVVALALILWPTSASAKSFQKVIDATNRIKTFRLAIRIFEGGGEQSVVVQGSEDVLDVQAPEGARIQISKSELRVYDPRKNELNVIRLGGLFDENAIEQVMQSAVSQGLGQLNVKKMLARFKEEYGGQNAKVSNIFEQDGQMVYTVDLSSPKTPEKVKITVNAESDLPLRIEVDGRQKVDIRVEFGQAVDIQPMESFVPADAKRTEYDLGKMIEGGLNQLGAGHQTDLKAFFKELKGMQRQMLNQVRESRQLSPAY